MYIEQCVSLVLYFGGKWENFVRVGSSRLSGSARRILSPTWEYYLGTVVRAVRA